MEQTGTLSVNSGETRLDGTLLAIENDDDPLGAATDFLANRDLGDGDRATVTGDEGSLGTEDVIFMTDAEPAAEAASKSAEKAAGKKSAGSGKGAASKKSSKKTSRKGLGK
jgi:hypothetical protein